TITRRIIPLKATGEAHPSPIAQPGNSRRTGTAASFDSRLGRGIRRAGLPITPVLNSLVERRQELTRRCERAQARIRSSRWSSIGADARPVVPAVMGRRLARRAGLRGRSL